MNRNSRFNGTRMDNVVCACRQLLRRGPIWLTLFAAAVVPVFASNIEIGTVTVNRSCNPAGVQLCTGTVVVLNEMQNFGMVNLSFNVGSNSFSDVPPQSLLANEAEEVEFQGGVDEYKNVHGATLLSVSGDLGGLSSPPLTFITSAGTFTASSDSWNSPQFQANFSGTLGIFVSATEVINTTPTPEPSSRALVLLVIGLLFAMRRRISLYLPRA
jgi:MYXO-CTERM domain-containing protein